MKKNMGTIDKSVRILIAALIAILYFTNTISGTLAIILGVLSIIFMATSLIGFCPIYPVLGINTLKKKKQ